MYFILVILQHFLILLRYWSVFYRDVPWYRCLSSAVVSRRQLEGIVVEHKPQQHHSQKIIVKKLCSLNQLLRFGGIFVLPCCWLGVFSYPCCCFCLLRLPLSVFWCQCHYVLFHHTWLTNASAFNVAWVMEQDFFELSLMISCKLFSFFILCHMFVFMNVACCYLCRDTAWNPLLRLFQSGRSIGQKELCIL